MPQAFKNIYIVGAQCSGKTTLVDALIRHFQISDKFNRHGHPTQQQPLCIKEVARTVLEEHKYTADDIVSSPDRSLRLQRLIMEAQHHAEAATDGRWFISDRSGVDPLIYAQRFVGEEGFTTLIQTDIWSQLYARLREGVVFVSEGCPSWRTDDGVRLMLKSEAEWLSIHHGFCETLDRLGIDYITIPKEVGNLGERVELVLRIWKDMR